ncbi:MAG: NAD(P)/FAD-dependent oxidoreductase, partial [Thermodesulfobacteriota bacterium]
MHSFDTIIIGAGPAGLSCAALLARQGRSVLVLEKNREIGPKVCAGGITWSGLREAIPESLVERRFQEQRIFSRLQRVTIKAAVPMVVTVDRGRLGRWMRDQAATAGAEIRSGCRVEAIGAATVATTAGEFGYTHLVGADGSNSLVRRHLDLPRQRVGIGLQFWLEKTLPDMEWHIDAGRFAGGYAWIFPHGRRSSVGIYAGRGLLQPRELRARLLGWAQERGLSLKGLQPEAYLINYDYRGSRFGKVHLVGDAAGLASPLTGEGI